MIQKLISHKTIAHITGSVKHDKKVSIPAQHQQKQKKHIIDAHIETKVQYIPFAKFMTK